MKTTTDLTVRDVIRAIDPTVPVHDTPLAILGGGGMYEPKCRMVFVTNQRATDGVSLAIAAHEAFHAVRHEHKARFFGLAKPGIQDRFREEKAANDLAEPWIRQHLPPGKQQDALGMIAWSRWIYTYPGQVYATGRMLIFELPLFLVVFVLTRWLLKAIRRKRRF